MAKKLTWDSEFLVKEEKALVGFLALVFLGLFLYALADLLVKGWDKAGISTYTVMLLLIPAALAAFFIRKFRSKRVFLRVNKKGIYQDEQFVTGWHNFINAYISQKEAKLVSVQDNFQLVIEYMKDGSDKGFRRKVPLTNTQNQSEEDVLAAIKFFFFQYRQLPH